MRAHAPSGDDCDCQRSCSCVYISVCFNDLLMDDCLSSERGFLAHSSVQPFPCLRFRAGLSPFWSSLSLFQSISSREVHIPPPCRTAPFESSTRTNVLKRKGQEEGWQACVTRERFTWGHKSRGEREGGIAHIKGSVCGDREVNWPSQSEGWTAHIHILPFTPCPPAEDFLALDKAPPPNHPHSLSCLVFPLEESGPPRYFIIVSRA